MIHLLTRLLRLPGTTSRRTRPPQRTVLFLEGLEERALPDATTPLAPPLLGPGLFGPAARGISLRPTTLTLGQVGTKYSQVLTPSGGKGPYHFSPVTTGLPPGITFNASKGTLSGTPTAAGVFTFTVHVSDSTPAGSGGPLTASPRFTLTVQRPARRVVFLSQPGNAPSGAVPIFQVEVLDALGNRLMGIAVKLTLKNIVSIVTPAFAKGGVTQATTTANGIATFKGVKISTRGRVELVATAGSGKTAPSKTSNFLDVLLLGRRSPP